MAKAIKLKGALCGCRAAGKYREMMGAQSLVITRFRDKELTSPLVVTPDWEIIPETGGHTAHIRRIRARVFLDVNGWKGHWHANLLAYGMKTFYALRNGRPRPYRRLYQYYDRKYDLFAEAFRGVPDMSKVLERFVFWIEKMTWKGFLRWAEQGLPPRWGV